MIRTLAIVTAFAFAWSTVASAQVGSGQPGVAAFLSAVNSTAEELRALGAEKSLSTHDIHVVSLEKISNPGNSATISKAISKNSAQIASLRDALKANGTVTAALSAAGVSVNQVVALDVEPGTGIHIYYQ
jgi:aminoglycoside/choline kinase family phosphotransferase